ncbi:MAG TPA: hypothetical protein VGD88_06190 [Opitutaceae bacterium]
MSAFPYQAPCTVLLRCNQFAEVKQHVKDTRAFRLLGNLQGENQPELWRGDGRWLESGERHDLDIIGVVVGRDKADNTVQVEPLAGAAGKKGPL